MNNKQALVLARQAAAGKADKVSAEASGNVASFDETGNLKNSGIASSDVAQKSGTLTSGNIASIDASGKFTDSGVSATGETWTFTLSDSTTVTKTVICTTVTPVLTSFASPLMTMASPMMATSSSDEEEENADGEIVTDTVDEEIASEEEDTDGEYIEVPDETASEADDRAGSGLLDEAED